MGSRESSPAGARQEKHTHSERDAKCGRKCPVLLAALKSLMSRRVPERFPEVRWERPARLWPQAVGAGGVAITAYAITEVPNPCFNEVHFEVQIKALEAAERLMSWQQP